MYYEGYSGVLGKPWVVMDGSPNRQEHIILAWVDGVEGGVLFVKTGPRVLNMQTGGGHNDQCWMTAKQWEAWKQATGARMVEREPI